MKDWLNKMKNIKSMADCDFLFLCTSVCVCAMCMAGTLRDQKGAADPLKLLGLKPGSLKKAAGALYHGAIYPAPLTLYIKLLSRDPARYIPMLGMLFSY